MMRLIVDLGGGAVVDGCFDIEAIDAAPPIFRALTRLGYSDPRIAEMTGKSLRTINHWSSGRKRCPPYMVVFLTDFTKADIEAHEIPAGIPAPYRERIETERDIARAWWKLSDARCALYPETVRKRALDFAWERADAMWDGRKETLTEIATLMKAPAPRLAASRRAPSTGGADDEDDTRSGHCLGT